MSDPWAVVGTTPAPAQAPASSPASASPAAADPWAVKSTAPAASAAAPATPPPSTRDAVIHLLTQPRNRAGGPDTRTASDLGLAPDATPEQISLARSAAPQDESWLHAFGRQRVGAAASMLLHPWDSVVGMIKQPAEAAAAIVAHDADHSVAWNRDRLAKEAADAQAVVDKARAEGKDPSLADRASAWLRTAVAHAHADTFDQISQFKKSFAADPAGTLADLGVQALVTHGVGEAVGVAARGTKAKLTAATKTPAKALLNVSPADTADMVREVGDKNITAEAAAQAKNAATLHDHAAKVQQVFQDNEAAKLDHASAMEDARTKAAADNQAAEQAAAAHQAAVDSANTDAQAATQQHAELAQQETSTRRELQSHMAADERRVKATVDKQFDAVRDKVKTAGETASLTPLLESVKEAEDLFHGSKERVAIFKDMMTRAQGASSTSYMDSLRRDIMKGRGMTGGYDELASGHKAVVDEIARGEIGKQVGSAESDPVAANSITFDHLRGYSSELGDMLQGNLDGDVRRAVRKVKSTVDAMAGDLAERAGAGEDLTAAKSNWRYYKSTFKEAAGSSGSGSPVAKGLDAADAYNATQPLLSEHPEVAERAKDMLVGSKEGVHYNPEAGRLLDQLRDIKKQQKMLPSANPLGEVEAKLPAEPAMAAKTQQQTAKSLSDKYGREVEFNPDTVQYEFKPNETYSVKRLDDNELRVTAHRNGKPVGRVDISHDDNGSGFTSGSLVPENMQKQGVATRLYKALPQLLKEHGITELQGESVKTDGGSALWNRLERNGHTYTADNVYGRPARFLKMDTQPEPYQAGGAVPEQPGLTKVSAPSLAEPPAPPKLVQPDLTDLTPERLDALRQNKILDSLTSWRRISPYRVAGMVAGTVGTVASLAGMIADANPSLTHSLQAGTLLSFATALGPRMLAKILDSPKIIKSLAKPSAADLREVMALPASQRTGVEAALRSLATEAQSRGKLSKPSPWLAILGATNGPARQQQQAGSGSGSNPGSGSGANSDAEQRRLLDEINRSMETLQDPSRPYNQTPPAAARTLPEED